MRAPRQVKSVEASENSVLSGPQPIIVGRTYMPRSLAEVFMKYIREGRMLGHIKDNLKDYRVTIEQFVKICDKYGI